MNSERDPFFQQIRILTISGVGGALKKKAQEFDQFVESAREIKDVNEKAAAVKRIKTEEPQIKRRIKIFT